MQSEEEQLRAMMREAVCNGIKDVIQDPEVVNAFWGSLFSYIQTQAKFQIGSSFFGVFGAVFKKVFWIIAVVSIVYSLGGWSAVAKIWGAFFTNGG